MTKDEFYFLLDQAKESFDAYDLFYRETGVNVSDNEIVLLSRSITMLDLARQGLSKIYENRGKKQ